MAATYVLGLSFRINTKGVKQVLWVEQANKEMTRGYHPTL